MIERDLYNGVLHVTHNPLARGRAPRYVVTVADKTLKPRGVTTILGQTLAKDFTQWAVDACCDYLKTKLPVVTEEDLQIGAREYIRLRDAGGSTGTEAHAMVEAYLKGGQPVAGSIEATNAYRAFHQWFESTEVEVINVEEVIYSNELGYAGTYDAMLRINGKVYLTDLKTTNPSRKAPNGVYAENFLQLGAYALAHEEQRRYEREHGSTDLLKIDGLAVISAKKDGKLDFVTADDVGLSVAECMALFGEVIELFKFMTETTKALGGK